MLSKSCCKGLYASFWDSQSTNGDTRAVVAQAVCVFHCNGFSFFWNLESFVKLVVLSGSVFHLTLSVETAECRRQIQRVSFRLALWRRLVSALPFFIYFEMLFFLFECLSLARSECQNCIESWSFGQGWYMLVWYQADCEAVCPSEQQVHISASLEPLQERIQAIMEPVSQFQRQVRAVYDRGGFFQLRIFRCYGYVYLYI
jgi:hypothetical protein